MAALPPQPIGQSQAYLAILDRVSDSAVLERPVLLVGERGTGKELIAKRLHFLSPRWEKVFITVNCAAFTDERLDEELFGESFLDGREDTNGKFYHADEGTIFLDNIDAVSPRLQEKLMGAIEYGRYEASGEHAEQEVDVRVISASAVDLPAAVARGAFPIGGGPAGALQFDPFEDPFRLKGDTRPSYTSEPAARALTPLIPRQFEAPETQPPDLQAAGFEDRVMAFERKLIDEALRVCENHQGKAAERLKLTYHQFRGLMRKHGLKK